MSNDEVLSPDRVSAWVYGFQWPPSATERGSAYNTNPTPPPSDQIMTDSSPKRRRVLRDDLERTPTPSDASSMNDLSYRLPRPPTLPTRYNASESSSRASATSNRSTSPPKNTKKFKLHTLKKPVLYKDLDENAFSQLPEDVQSLHQRIDDIVVLRSHFLPNSIRHEVSSAMGRELPESSFTRPDVAEDHDRELRRFRSLQHIIAKSRRCRELGRGESGLNWKVHEPLLELALEDFGGTIESEPATDARILPEFLPRTDGSKAPLESKIDIAIVLDPTIVGKDEELAKMIQQAVMSQPEGMQSASHTSYHPFNFRPPASFIETKATGSADEGRTQLGIYVAAQHQRFESFIRWRQAVAVKDFEACVITLPHILTVEHDWKLFYGCDRRSCLDMIGDISIGDTKSLLGGYTVLAVLRAIGDYIATQFRNWIYDLFATSE